MNDVIISYYKQSVLVTGKSFSIKDTLKSLGGSWNKTLGGWVFRKRDREAVVSRLRALPEVNVTDNTAGVAGGSAGAVATAAAGATIAAATARSARSASAEAEADDYSDLASLPTPNKDKFGRGGVPGEMRIPGTIPMQILRHIMSTESGRIIERTSHGDVFEARSRQQREEQRQEDEAADEGVPAGGYMPKISIEDSRTRVCKRTENFVCDGTMYRHTGVSWKDAPVEFKRSHEVDAKKEAPAQSICYENKIEDLTPFDCQVYWEIVWEKCSSCDKADQAFKRWAMRASTPGAMAARKKRTLDEVASAPTSPSAGEADGQGDAKIRKGNLKTE